MTLECETCDRRDCYVLVHCPCGKKVCYNCWDVAHKAHRKGVK